MKNKEKNKWPKQKLKNKECSRQKKKREKTNQ